MMDEYFFAMDKRDVQIKAQHDKFMKEAQEDAKLSSANNME
jgi:hypothetical protein